MVMMIKWLGGNLGILDSRLFRIINWGNFTFRLNFSQFNYSWTASSDRTLAGSMGIETRFEWFVHRIYLALHHAFIRIINHVFKCIIHLCFDTWVIVVNFSVTVVHDFVLI